MLRQPRLRAQRSGPFGGGTSSLSRDATLSLLAEARSTLEQVFAELLGYARERGSRVVGYVLSTLDDLERAVAAAVPPDGLGKSS